MAADDDKEKMFERDRNVEDGVGQQPLWRRWRHPPHPAASVSVVSRCLVGLSIVLLAALVVTGLVVTFNLLADVIPQLCDDELNGIDRGIDELNVVEYHVTGTDKHQQTWAIADFNKEIQILKVIGGYNVDQDGGDDDEAVCYVTPLQHGDTVSATSKDTATTAKKSFEALPSRIKDTSVLGPKGEALCKGSNVYWMVPRCPENGAMVGRNDVTDSSTTYVVRHVTARDVIDGGDVISGSNRKRRDLLLISQTPVTFRQQPREASESRLRTIDVYERIRVRVTRKPSTR